MSHSKPKRIVKLNDPCPFRPDPSLLHSFDEIPRYLFRLVAPSTANITTETEVISGASLSGEVERMKDLFQLPDEIAAENLNDHFHWEFSHQEKCNYTSWTSSLLTALQLGFYRHTMDYDKPDCNSIFLFILDTRDFPKGTFVKDLDLMEIFRVHIDPHLLQWRKGDFYFGEYLCQGDLNIDGKCAKTSIKSLTDHGLFKLHRELGNGEKWVKWALRVVALRIPFTHYYEDLATTHEEVRIAITMAQACYGGRWTVPMAAMLLALKPRQRHDSVIREGFRAMFSAQEIEDLALGDLSIDGRRLPEVKQFGTIIRDIQHRSEGDDVLENSFEGLAYVFRERDLTMEVALLTWLGFNPFFCDASALSLSK